MKKTNQTVRVFDGATAIITGGASGIGRALAHELARRGSEVVIADLQEELAIKTVEDIRTGGGNASAVTVDVTDYPALKALVDETVRRAGRLDYMFNNAGIAITGPVSCYGIEDWNRIIEVNLGGVCNGVQAAYPVMLKQGFGHIVNTASMAGLVPVPVLVGYTAVKHAVVGLSTALRAEAATAGVRVSVLCPGVIRTAIVKDGGKFGKVLEDIPPEVFNEIAKKTKAMDPGIFAHKVLNKIAKNKSIIIVPAWWKIFWWLNRVSPVLGVAFARKFFRDAQVLREKYLGQSR